MSDHVKAVLAVVGTWALVLVLAYLIFNQPVAFMYLMIAGIVGLFSVMFYAMARLLLEDDDDFPL